MLDLKSAVFWSFGAFDFLVWVHICVLDPHKFLTLIPLCFFWYIFLFLFPDLQNPLFSTILFWLILLMKINFHIRKFWASGFCKIEVLEKGQKKNQFKKRNRKKNDKYYKNSVQSWRYNWRIWALILENLLKKNGACVWSETNAKIWWDLDLFESQISEANIKRPTQHKSVKITHSGPQQFVSVVQFFILKSNLVLFHRFHFVCYPFFEYLFICLSNISLKLFLVVTFNPICVVLFFKLICFLL